MPAGPAAAATLRHAGEAGPAGDVAAAGVVASLARELAALAPAARVSRAEALVRDHERQIRKKLAEGVTSKVICALLAGHGAPLSPRHLRRILRKLDDRRAAGERGGASRRAEGARAAPAGPSPPCGQAAGGAAAGGGRPLSSGPREAVQPCEAAWPAVAERSVGRDVRPRPAECQPDMFDEADDDAEEPS